MPSGTTVMLSNKLHRYSHLLPYCNSQETKSITGPRFLWPWPVPQCKCCQLTDILELSCHLINEGLPTKWQRPSYSETGFFQLWPPWLKNVLFALHATVPLHHNKLPLLFSYSFSTFYCCFLSQWLYCHMPCFGCYYTNTFRAAVESRSGSC